MANTFRVPSVECWVSDKTQSRKSEQEHITSKGHKELKEKFFCDLCVLCGWHYFLRFAKRVDSRLPDLPVNG
jgi:hypothetical protein